MITPEQTREIREYLLSKRLPIDILMEVEDHFVNQINCLQQDGLGFSEAFSQVQSSWLSDLKMTYDARYSLDDITQLAKNITRTQQNRMLKKSALSGLAGAALAYCGGLLLPGDVFGVLLLAIMILVAAVPILRFILHSKDFFLPRKYPNFQLSVFQNSNAISMLLVGGTLGWIPRLQGWAETFYHHPAKILALEISLFLWFAGHTFCFLNQTQYLRAIAKIKPYLLKISIY